MHRHRSLRPRILAVQGTCILIVTFCLTLVLFYAASLLPNHASDDIMRRNAGSFSDKYTEAADVWADDIKCYAVPYGAVGFVNHLWTYWTMLLLVCSRRPLMPWKKLSSNWLDMALSAVQGIITFALNIVNINRCRFSWQLVLVTVWKMMLSLGQSICGLQSSYCAIRDEKKPSVAASDTDMTGYVPLLVWLPFYGCACLIGMVGLGNIQRHIGYIPGVLLHHAKGSAEGAKCEIITLVFALVVVLGLGLFGCVGSCAFDDDESGGPLGAGLMLIAIGAVFFFALYSDWILGVIAQNVPGDPSEFKAYYWVRFCAKRPCSGYQLTSYTVVFCVEAATFFLMVDSSYYEVL